MQKSSLVKITRVCGRLLSRLAFPAFLFVPVVPLHSAGLPPGCVSGFTVKHSGGDYFLIQDALDALPKNLTGDTCVVVTNDGSYSEEVTVQGFTNNGYRLKIMADPAGGLVTVSPPPGSTAGFLLYNSSVTLSRIEVIPGGSMPYGILSSADNVTISSCSVVSAGSISSSGIYISNSSRVEYSSSVVENAQAISINGNLNRVEVGLYTSSNMSKHALSLEGGSSSNTITGIYASNPPGYGGFIGSGANFNTVDLSTITCDTQGPQAFLITGASYNLISRSYIYNPSGHVLHIMNSSDNMVDSSTIMGNSSGYYSLFINNSQRNTVSNSYIKAPSGTALHFYGGSSNNTVSQSTMTTGGALKHAVYLNPGSSNSVTGCYMESAAGSVVEFKAGSSYNAFEDSSFYGASGNPVFQVSGSSFNHVSNSFVYNTSGPGLVISYGAGNSVAGSTITSSPGIRMDPGNKGTLYISSSVIGGGLLGMSVDSSLGGLALSVAGLDFSPLSAGATAISFLNGVMVSTLTGVNFGEAGMEINVDASALEPGSRITMKNYSGGRAGPSHENDPSAYVDWYVPDLFPPELAILYPANSSNLNYLSAITGTASDNVAVASVTVSLSRQDNGLYWDGATWVGGPDWLGCSVFTSSWAYANMPPLLGGTTYTVVAKAMDTSANWSVAYATSTFVYGVDLPAGCASAVTVKHFGGDYSSIQDALDALPKNLTGDTCVVVTNDGSYSEEVTVQGFTNNGYRLKIMADPAGGSPMVSPQPGATAGFLLYNSSVTISRMDVIPAGSIPYGILASSDSAVISSVTVVSAGSISDAGISVSSTSYISDSYVVTEFSAGIQLNGGGNAVERSSATNNEEFRGALSINGVASNTITGSYFINSAGAGLQLSTGANNNVILNNVFVSEGSGAAALYLAGASFNWLAGNSFSNTGDGYAAALFGNSDHNTISQSTITSNASGAPALYFSGASSNLVVGSYISNPSGIGVLITRGGSNTIRLSTVTNNSANPALSLVSSSSNTVIDSYIQGLYAAAYISGSTGTVIGGSSLLGTSSTGIGLYLRYGSLNLDLSSSTLAGGIQGSGIYLDPDNSGALNISSNTIKGGGYGLNVAVQNSGAVLNVSSITFQSLSAGATAVNFISGMFVSTFAGVAFDSANIAVNVNGSLLSPGSRVTMRDYYGPRAGVAYENDASGYVDWDGTDLYPPELALLDPANSTYRSSLSAITGTASDNVAVASVTVALSRQDNGLYWDGATWVGGQTWLNATVFTSSWTYSNIPALVDGSTYAVFAKAMDGFGNWSDMAANIFYKDATGCYWPVWSVQTGAWSSTTTWDRGAVPSACSSVVISSGNVVTLDSASNQVRGVELNGSLVFRRTGNSLFTLAGNDLNINSGGTLDMGTEASPIPSNYTATLVLSSGAYAGQRGLIVNDGGNFTARGAVKTPYSYAVQSIGMENSVKVYGSTSTQGWQVGDTITISPTSGSGTGLADTRTIYIIDNSAAPLYNILWPGVEGSLSAPRTLSPDTPIVVTNLSRNVMVRSSGTIVDGNMSNAAKIINRSRSAAGFKVSYADFSFLGSMLGWKYGLAFEASSRGEISSSTFRNSTYGLYLYNSSGSTFYGNNFYANSYSGIKLQNSSNNIFVGNNFMRNQGFGIFIYNYSNNNALAGNNSYSNANYGIYLYDSCDSNTLAGNYSHSNSGYGIDFVTSSDNLAAGNKIYANANTGVYLDISSNNNLFIGNSIHSNSGSGISLSDSINNVIADSALGYDASGADRHNTVAEVAFDPAKVNSLVLKRARINPSVGIFSPGFDQAGSCLLSYGQDYSTGSVRLQGGCRIAGTTLSLDYETQLYASANTTPKLMRGTGHSISAVVTKDAQTLSEIITVTHTGGNSWLVTGSSSGILGTFSQGVLGSYNFSHAKVDFTLDAGAVLNPGDALDFATTAASNDAGRQKKLLFGPAAATFNMGASGLELSPTAGITLRGKNDGTANTLVDMLNSNSTYYTFVDSGSFTAAFSSFSNMRAGGLQLSGSGGVDISSSTFDYLGFAAGTNSYITARDLISDATFYNVSFGLSRSSAGAAFVYNVRTEGSDAGLLWHFLDGPAGRGPLWGEAYDYEQGASNKVLWGDVITPDIVIIQPPAAQYLKALPLIYGTAADDLEVTSVTVSLSRLADGFYWKGSQWLPEQNWLNAQLFTSSWTYSGIPALLDGESYNITARAMDEWGNWSAVYSTRTFIYDQGLPIAPVAVPVNGSDVTVYTGISGTAWDAGSAAALVWVKVRRLDDGLYWNEAVSQWTVPEAWNLAAGTDTWEFTGLPEGELTSWTSYYAVAHATDLTGNVQIFDFQGSTFTYVIPPALPGAAAIPSGSVLGISSIAWSWDAITGVSGYNVYTASAPAALIASPAVPFYIREGLTPNTSYSIMVAGDNFSGQGSVSTASAVLVTLAAPPAGVAASGIYFSSVTLAWGLNANPPGTSARVLRLSGSTVTTSGLTHTETGLLGCTSYYFRVWNVNSVGVATPYSEIGPALTGNPVPPPPGSLYAAAQAGGRVALTWQAAPFEGITGYRLYYDNGTGVINYVAPLATVSSAQTSYTTGVLTSSAAYKFGLRAVHRCGVEESNTSLAAAAPSLPSLTGVRAAIKIPQTGKRVNGNSVTVMAELVTGTAAGTKDLRFQYKASASGTWQNITASDQVNHPNPDSTSPYFIHWDVTGLVAGPYDIRAVASDLSNNADPSPAAITILVGAEEADITENISGGKVTKEQKVNNLVSNTLQAADSASAQVTTLQIPSGALDSSTATVTVTNNPAVTPPAPEDAEAAGVVTEVTLSNQSVLAGGLTAEITLLFPDADNNGIVDGTTMNANLLEMYSARTAAGPWEKDLSSVVDVLDKKVTGHTSHFSFFALFAPQAVNINSARAFPVPWKPGSGGKFDSAPGTVGIIFDNLTDKTEISIFTITGRLVRKLTLTSSDLGFKVWDGNNSAGKKAASGVYIAHIKSGSHVKVLKIAVER